MPRKEVLAAMLFAVVGIAVFFRGVRAVQTGEIKAKYRTYVRAESPTMFWVSVVGEFGIALVLMPIVIRWLMNRR